ncbi:MAG: polymerase [Caulobacter sp.]|nr:polymerase [Caulobacter sp.]
MTDADTAQEPRPLTQDGPPIRLYLVDGSAYIFRAYHALPPLTRKSDGLPVGAVSGFCNMLFKLLRDTKEDAPTHFAVIFDHSEKTFRNQMYDLYKAHRPPPPEDLVPQFALVRDATRAFGVPCIELPGYEADDLIAAYACRVRELGGETIIVSSDKDLMQLVGDGVTMLDTMKNVRIGPDQVFEKFGVMPDKVVDVQALCGDSVDNVPGAPGIGIKTAALLINEFGDLDTLLERAGEIKQEKRRQTLIDFADQIRLSRALVRLDCDTPLPEPVDDLGVREPDKATLAAFLEEMGFNTLLRRIGAAADGTGMAPQPLPTFAPMKGLGAPEPTPATPEQAAIEIDVTRYECVRDLETLDRWIARAYEAGVVAFDTETDALGSATAGLCGVSLAVAPGEACYIPLTHEAVGGDLLTEAAPVEQQIDKATALARLKPLLESPAVLKVAQNAKYDIAVMALRGINVAPIDDTMLISYVLEAGLHNHGMDELSELWLGHKPIPFKQVAGTGKAQISFKHVALNEATCYAAEDADVTLRLWHKLKPRLAREGLLTVYETLERPLPPVIAAMENAGVKVDTDELRRLSHDFSLRMADFEAKAHELLGRPFNLGSPSRSARCCSARWGWRAARRPPPASGRPTSMCWSGWRRRAPSCPA